MREQRLRETHPKSCGIAPQGGQLALAGSSPTIGAQMALTWCPQGDGGGLRAAGPHWGCSPVKREQLAVTAEGVAAEVNELQLAETGQGGQCLQLVLLQV